MAKKEKTEEAPKPKDTTGVGARPNDRGSKPKK
jgi:hypothetical protein